MNVELSMLRKRLTGLVLILPLIVGLAVAAYKFGPSPARSVEQVATSPAPPPELRKAEPSPPPDSQLFELFGMYQTAVAKGRVQATPSEYLNSLEALYLRRGYRKVERLNEQSEPQRKPARRVRKEPAAPIKFFLRDETNGIANLSATGADADYSSDQSAPEPYTFSTLVVPAKSGGADWATYRMGIDQSKMAQLGNLDHGDFPGADPREVPRLPGLQRIYALTSGSGSIAIYKSNGTAHAGLVRRYLEEMPRHGWRLDSAATADANKVAAGVMFFIKGTRSCLIWVTPNDETGTTNVTISSH